MTMRYYSIAMYRAGYSVVLLQVLFSSLILLQPSFAFFHVKPRSTLLILHSFLRRRQFLLSLATAPVMSSNNDLSIVDKPLRVAILGSGIFAKTAHYPILQRSPKKFTCVAVWSRKTIPDFAPEADVYIGMDDLRDKLLKRDDIDAVVMALPLDVQPDYLPMVWQANKHVLSEKPIAANVNIASTLIDKYNSINNSSSNNNDNNNVLHWMVGENFRYEPAWQYMRDVIQQQQQLIGDTLILVTLNIRSPFLPDNQFLNTAWRKSPSWGDDGLFIDALVHATAGLRLVIGTNPDTVRATTSSVADYLPGKDTMVGTMIWNEYSSNSNYNEQSPPPLLGTISVSYAGTKRSFELEVVGNKGRAVLRRGGPGWQVKVDNTDNSKSWKDFEFAGLENEWDAFADCIQKGKLHKNTANAALQDLKLVEALLKSNGDSVNV